MTTFPAMRERIAAAMAAQLRRTGRSSQSYALALAGAVSAHSTATLLRGSILSHFRQRRSVRPVLSVIAINRFLHFGQRAISMENHMALSV